MQNPKETIIENLKNWLKEKSLEAEFEVSLSQNLKFGDFATNIALVLSKQLGKNPHAIAEELKLEIENWSAGGRIDFLDRVEVAGAGFINFYLSKTYLSDYLTKIVQSENPGALSDTKTPQKIIVEFGDPNPFKEIHIGHLRNFCIGESFSRLLESQGNQVIRANYQGDVGLHVAKAMLGLLKREEKFLDSGVSEDEKIKILAESYVEGATEFENNEESKQAIIEINKKIYEDDESLHQLWEEGRKVSLEHFEELYKKLGIRYDKYYFESVTAKKGKEIVLSHIEDGVFEKDDGAVVYRGERDGLHTRVFLTSKEYATYEGKDLSLAIIKNEDEGYDESVILTGNEQLEYFQVMLAALKRIEPELAARTKHFTFGHVRLKEGKMSSRTGDVISANWLLDEAIKKVREAFTDMDPATSEKVGIGAVKYSMLKFSIPSDIHFSFEESISLEGNSGPYLQYAYVRTQSVLGKAVTSHSEQGEESRSFTSVQDDSFKFEAEESELLRFLTQYPYVLEQSAKEFAPNLLCNYLFELAQKFNLFYQKCNILNPVIASDAKHSIGEVRDFRLELTKAVGIVLKNGLSNLGIETVEKM